MREERTFYQVAGMHGSIRHHLACPIDAALVPHVALLLRRGRQNTVTACLYVAAASLRRALVLARRTLNWLCAKRLISFPIPGIDTDTGDEFIQDAILPLISRL
jgi:hypothetical protein